MTREATSDRVTLGVTAVLTLSAISMDSRSDLPKVIKIKINCSLYSRQLLLSGNNNPGSLRYCPGLVHNMQLPLLYGLNTRVCRGPLLHQGWGLVFFNYSHAKHVLTIRLAAENHMAREAKRKSVLMMSWMPAMTRMMTGRTWRSGGRQTPPSQSAASGQASPTAPRPPDR